MLIGLCLVLAGCGSIKKQWDEFTPDRDEDYLDAESVPAVKTPEGVTVNKAYQTDPYPLPKGKLPPKGAKPADIYPPDLKKDPSHNDEPEDDDDDNDADEA
jgi:uncharacterized lipoprotein